MRAELVWRDGDQLLSHAVLIDVARQRDPARADDPRVDQAFAILDALRKVGDRDAERSALQARLELAQLEHRDPGLQAALQKQIDVFEGRIDRSHLTSADAQYLEADLRTNAGA